jgi:tRNA(Ile2) C34 agmatinyltransferase TiaS
MSTTFETPVVTESHSDPQLTNITYVGREADVTLDDDWVPKPTCEGCHLEMQPIGRGGWWCEPCQEFQ